MVKVPKSSVTLLASAAAIALTATSAEAQDSTRVQEDPAAGVVEEIIVTAQRRGENLQKVPIAVTAVTAKMAEAMGVRGTQDLAIAAPAVNFAATNAGGTVTIRGVGASGSSVDEGANAVYVDGVYQAAQTGLVFNFNSIERLEVLKGPQGTLFGRNSIGGVIQVITRAPSATPTADLSVGYANYQTVETKAYVSGGLAPGLAADVAIFNRSQGQGWGRNLFNGLETYKGRDFALRTKVRWEIDPDTDLTFVYSHVASKPTSAQGGGLYPGQRSLTIPGVPAATYAGFYNVDYDASFVHKLKQDQFALTVEHDMGWASIVNIASYSKATFTLRQDADLGRAPLARLDLINPDHTYTEELQLLSPASSPIKWSAGLFFLSNSIEARQGVTTGLALGSPTARQVLDDAFKVRSRSAYGQATVPIFAATNLTLGLRYTSDRRSISGTTTAVNGAVTTLNAKDTDRKLTWRIAVDQQFSDAVLGYVSYNRGFKNGLYNISVPTQPAVLPQVIDAYEVGLKSELFDRRLRLNLASFYYDFKDIQVRAVNALGQAILLNATSAKVKGVDVDVVATPVANLTIQGSLSYLDSRYDSFTQRPLLHSAP